MSRRVNALVLCLATAVLLVGCGGDDGSGPSGSGFLFENNAQFNGGRTVRWPALPIRVFLGNGVAAPGEVTVWTAETGGLVQFTLVGSASGAGVVFRFSNRTDICGETLIQYTDDGQITSAEVDVSRSIYRGPQCVRTVTHETAHAIGFLNHTDDGGLMDDDGGNGEVTPPRMEHTGDIEITGTYEAGSLGDAGLKVASTTRVDDFNAEKLQN